MTINELKQHYEANQGRLDLYISGEIKDRPQEGDLMNPLLTYYTQETGLTINNCPECLLDVIRFAKSEIKKNEVEPIKKNKK